MAELRADMMSEEEYIEHFGVKGMKWGRRQAAPMNTIHTSADAARVNKINSRLKKNGLDNLSNDDIAKLNKRNQLVAEYKKQNPGKFEKGAKATQETVKRLKTAGTVVAGAAALGIAGVAIAKGFNNLAQGPTPDLSRRATGAVLASGGKAVLDVLKKL